ncbi:MAG TPA: tetratricopeptide repeat protein [Devosia sp.]|uniref:tetratricopeptide repeat protein n=1 Tax=Devosia sp. TaxID=1871048 RepID=UPI002F9402A4
MRTIRGVSLISVTMGVILASAPVMPVHAQTAADAAMDMANMLDGAGGGVSGDDLVEVLEDAAEAGQPMALWQLGNMYESGEGVDRDPAKAFGYFSKIADPYSEVFPNGTNADIVAESFVKVSEYYKDGLPEAGISENLAEAHKMLLHASDILGDADAQYRLAQLYIERPEFGVPPLMAARYYYSAAQKGHCAAQAQLGHMLFQGAKGMEPKPIDGLMWMAIAQRTCVGTLDAAWVDQLYVDASALASADERDQALARAQTVIPQLGTL